jgi:hypothetical protein
MRGLNGLLQTQTGRRESCRLSTPAFVRACSSFVTSIHSKGVRHCAADSRESSYLASFNAQSRASQDYSLESDAMGACSVRFSITASRVLVNAMKAYSNRSIVLD